MEKSSDFFIDYYTWYIKMKYKYRFSWSILFLLLHACSPIQKKETKISLSNSSDIFNRIYEKDCWWKSDNGCKFKQLIYSNSFFSRFAIHKTSNYNQHEIVDFIKSFEEDVFRLVSVYSQEFMKNENAEMQEVRTLVQLSSAMNIDDISKREINHKDDQVKFETTINDIKMKKRYRLKTRRTISMNYRYIKPEQAK